MKFFDQRGQTIIEVLIATTVVVVVMTAIASGLTYSVKNTSEAKYRGVATNQAQEAMEVYRRERNLLGWQTFYTEAGDGIYCLNTLPLSSTQFSELVAAPCDGGVVVAGTEFEREAQVVPVNDTEVQVTITVSWNDGNRQRQVAINQVFRQWDL